MKHFRDLVLSLREPVLHNVLWIKPDKNDLAKYWVLMYEDGWKPLFGEAGSSTRGINYTVVKNLPDGYIVQLIDDSVDPSNPTNLYPKTKAKYVYLSNSVDIETAINDINTKLNTISNTVKYAIYTDAEALSGYTKTGKTYWVTTGQTDDEDLGEGMLRTYTSENTYTAVDLKKCDLVMFTNELFDDRLGYVDNIYTEQLIGTTTQVKRAAIKRLATKAYVDILFNNILQSVVQSVTVDGQSVVNEGVAELYAYIKPVYIVNYSNLENYYRGDAKIGKTFYTPAGENMPDKVVRCTSADISEAVNVPLENGTILYNLDTNGDYDEYSFYQFTVVDNGVRVHNYLFKLVSEANLNDLLYQQFAYLHRTVLSEANAYTDQKTNNTPKYYDADWIITQQDPNNPGIIPYVEYPEDEDDPLPTPEERFHEMWQAIYNSRSLSHRNIKTTPNLIIMDGQPAYYYDTLYLDYDPNTWPEQEEPYELAQDFTLKYWSSGDEPVVYEVTKDEDENHNIILRVEVS